MMTGISFISISIGMIAAITTLFAGSSIIVAVLVCMSASSLTVFLLVALTILREDLGEIYAASQARS